MVSGKLRLGGSGRHLAKRLRNGGVLYNVIDTLVVIICLPFYAVAFPLVLTWEWFSQRRPVPLGKQITHWVARDLREDWLAVDVSRAGEGLVGIRRRRWGWKGPPPPFSGDIEYISTRTFWVPSPLFYR